MAHQLATTRSQSFFDRYGQSDFPPLLSGIEKMDLAQTGVTFDVLKVRRSNMEKGECWVIDIDLGGTVQALAFQVDKDKTTGADLDSQRNRMFEAMTGEIRENGPMEGIRLFVTETKSGNEFFYLGMPEEETEEASF